MFDGTIERTEPNELGRVDVPLPSEPLAGVERAPTEPGELPR